MSFADNLAYLRQHYGITQEGLAEQLGVSRQTISKWEAGINFPETDKLLLLCDMYNTNLDDLMRGDVRITNKQDTELYDAHMNRLTWQITFAVMVAIIGVSAMLFLEAVGIPERVCTMVFFACVIICAIVSIVAGMGHSEFKRKHPTIDPNYPTEVLDRFGRRFIALVATGIGIIMLDLLALIGFLPEDDEVQQILGTTLNEDASMGLFLFVVALATGILVYAGMQKSKYDKSEITYVSTDGKRVSGAFSHHTTPEALQRDRIIGSLCGAIMLLATIAFFVIGFSDGFDGGAFGNWRSSGFAHSWIAFVVGGLLCGIVSIIGSMFGQTKEEVVAEARKENPWLMVDGERPEDEKGSEGMSR